jgi:hypothetical protein
MRIGAGVSEMVSFIDYQNAEEWRWVQFQQPSPPLTAIPAKQIILTPKQLKVNNRSRVLRRPSSIQVRLSQAISQRFRRQWTKILIEPTHLLLPLSHQSLRADDQHISDLLARLEFLQN